MEGGVSISNIDEYISKLTNNISVITEQIRERESYDNNIDDLNIDEHINDVTEQISEVNEQIRESNDIINENYKKIEKLSNAKEKKLLNEQIKHNMGIKKRMEDLLPVLQKRLKDFSLEKEHFQQMQEDFKQLKSQMQEELKQLEQLKSQMQEELKQLKQLKQLKSQLKSNDSEVADVGDEEEVVADAEDEEEVVKVADAATVETMSEKQNEKNEEKVADSD